jgi:hypothetical protein
VRPAGARVGQRGVDVGGLERRVGADERRGQRLAQRRDRFREGGIRQGATSSTSRGRRRASSPSAVATVGTLPSPSSPVDRSNIESPTPAFVTSNAASQLLARASRWSSCVAVPGVMTRTTARGTMPLVSFGSAICSQMATLCPSASNLPM